MQQVQRQSHTKEDVSMYNSKFINDYVFYLKLHEQLRMSTNDRNKFWKEYAGVN
jgi:hypothetical protein